MTAPTTAPAPPARPFTAPELAEAVLLFWQPGLWTDAKQSRWNEVTRRSDESQVAMGTVLVEMARSVLGHDVTLEPAPSTEPR